jgi:hypothetical protein
LEVLLQIPAQVLLLLFGEGEGELAVKRQRKLPLLAKGDSNAVAILTRSGPVDDA